MSAPARHLIPLLAACSAIGSVGNFLFLPALPQIAKHFEVASGTATLTITTYLVAFAFGVLLSGPLADRFGRRPILIGGVALSGVAALTCYFAPTMGWFVVARIVQGATGGAGITVSRASVGLASNSWRTVSGPIRTTSVSTSATARASAACLPYIPASPKNSPALTVAIPAGLLGPKVTT